jgi:hypothetical protein
MPALQRFAGIAMLTVDGAQMNLRGNFTVSPSMVERTMIAGQDRIHGYQELPRVPFIEGDISVTPDLNLAAVEQQINVTVVAWLSNGKVYNLANAMIKSNMEVNTRDGQVRLRWEGVSVTETTSGVGPPAFTMGSQ